MWKNERRIIELFPPFWENPFHRLNSGFIFGLRLDSFLTKRFDWDLIKLSTEYTDAALGKQ